MSNKLVLTTTAGLVLCAVFLGLAVAIGGDDVFHDARSLKEVRPLIDLATHKAWRWNGGDTLALDAPINIRYEPKGMPQVDGTPQVNSAPQVSMTGPPELLRHVKVSDGRITADTSVTHASGKRVEAVVSGAPIRKFVVNNLENLDLGDLSQEALELHLNGSGTVSGRGKVDHLNLTIAGPGDANLGGLEVMGEAKISILGSGDATLSPHGRVKLFIAGNGDLRLLTKPTELRQTIIGNGEVSQLEGEAAQKAFRAVDIARIASEATENAVSNAQIQQQVQEKMHAHRGGSFRPPMPPFPPSVMENAKTGSVVVPGSKDVDLGHVEQESLNLTIASSGSVTAEGKVDRLAVDVMGSGQARLGKLAARRVSVMVMGSGSAMVAPSEELKVHIMGSGDVHLLTRPPKIERSIMGSGRIIEAR